MKKTFKVIIIIVLCLGVILIGTGLVITKGNLKGIFEEETRVSKRIDETVAVTSLSLEIASDDVEFYTSEDTNVHIDYWDSDKRPYVYTCEGGTATLKQSLTIKKWFNWFGIWNKKTVKVYLPASVNQNLSVKISSGELKIEECPVNVNIMNIHISSGDVKINNACVNIAYINMSSGNITLTKFTAENINANLSSGHFYLTNSTVIGKIDLNQSSGSNQINGCTINELSVDMSSGKLNAGNLIVNSVNAELSSGDVNLRIKGEPSDYRIEIDLSSGKSSIEGKGTNFSGSDLKWGTGSKIIDCESSSGDVKITFID